MKNFKISRGTFPSGLRYVLMPRSETQTVTFMVLVGVGSRYETPKQSGLSHFLEHMLFKGTERRPDKREISEALDSVGAEFNAFTGEEVTGYYVKVAKERLELGADVVSDILLHSLFPTAEIEQERGVIIEEIRMYTDTPMRHVWHLWNEALFGDHPLGRRIDGSIETVSSFTRSDFVRYTKAHYHTGNTVVAVAGNFREDKVKHLLQKLFADLEKGKETSPRPAPKRVPARRFVHEKRESLDQTHLMVGVPGLSLKDKSRWAGEILATVLGGGMSSRLFMRVREEHGLAYSVRTHLEGFVDSGAFVTQAGLRTDKAYFALQIILEEYDRVMEEPIPDVELNKAKQMVRGRMVLGLEETNALAIYAGGQELLEHEFHSPQEAWEQIEKVTAQDVRKLARRLLDSKQRAVALLSPHSSTKKFENLLK